MGQRLAVISVSAGAGHVRAAEALRAQAALSHPDTEVLHIDLMDHVSKVFRRLYAGSYNKVVERHPRMWGYLYNWTDRHTGRHMINRLRKAIESLSTRKLRGVLSDFGPDHIIVTHFLPAQLLSRMRRKHWLECPCWVQVTDYDIHLLWIHPHLEGYFAATEEVAWRMVSRGLTEDEVHVAGIPIAPVFDPSALDRAACAAELGLRLDRRTLLLMAGGAGVGRLDLQARVLLEQRDDFQMVVIAGRNVLQLNMLQELARQFPGRLFPLGYTTTIERVMAVSDLAVTKPGGLTSSECLAMGLPMIVISPIPGQEERNADYLLENGVALKAYDLTGLTYRVRHLLENPGQLDAMRGRAQVMARPQAARAVLDKVLGPGQGG